jgi:hypothetical protein
VLFCRELFRLKYTLNQRVNIGLNVYMQLRTSTLLMGLLAGIGSSAAASAATPQGELTVSFNQLPVKQIYTGKLFQQDWQSAVWDGTRGRACIEIDKANPRSRLLRIKYPAHQVGPVKSGGQALVRLQQAEEYYLSYRVRFQPNFDFRKGGKLPGLASGDGKYSNGVKPVHGDGWTARLMWLNDGKLVPYVYYVGMPKENHWGESWETNTFLKPDVWYTITQRIRLNNSGKSDGTYTIWLNNQKIADRHDMLWRYGNKGMIDSFIFSTFHGGNTADWAPRWDCYADFDDFRIAATPPTILKTVLSQR